MLYMEYPHLSVNNLRELTSKKICTIFNLVQAFSQDDFAWRVNVKLLCFLKMLRQHS